MNWTVKNWFAQDIFEPDLNSYDRKSIEIVIGLGALWNWIDIACKCPFLHQNLNLTARFASSNLNLEIKKGKFYISQVKCYRVSVASEQQHNRDLKRREYKFITFYQNALHLTRVHCATAVFAKSIAKWTELISTDKLTDPHPERIVLVVYTHRFK